MTTRGAVGVLVERLPGLEDPPADVLTDVEREATDLLDRMATDPEARRRYAEIADRQGWPCYGTTWPEWAAAVTAALEQSFAVKELEVCG